MLQTLKQRNIAQARYVNYKCVALQHEDNFHLLNLLCPENIEKNQPLVSTHSHRPKLIFKPLECFKYTHEFEMLYEFENSQSESVVIRSYLDARVAELMYCTDFQKFIRLLGPRVSPQVHFKTRMSLNRFLNKWLNYLLLNGYSSQKWEAIDESE